MAKLVMERLPIETYRLKPRVLVLEELLLQFLPDSATSAPFLMMDL